ncbi:Bicupin, oxalate decarboxylase/oxidase [Terfezia boudieri ATCC MYA-4762]|uniref:Bicupin, oxalate decarboxylase/oxidase n=1 Tax=Terfezia boudieri ATCC MYA-4762 TaxID=1051890 RepID=A0A3N4LE38_9PEZI|nr:Bicupin, oxalate decarboxylase/oxidase [Terfezia boudieri ATCC MYA-4762]
MHHSLVLVFLWVVSKSFAAPAAISLEATKSYTLSGDLRGPTTLRGYDESYPFPTQNTHPDKIEYAPGQKLDEPEGGFLDFNDIDNPQPLRGNRGGTIASNRNIALEKQHPDSFAPPITDKGSVAQLEWPLGLSHVKLGHDKAGFSRQQNIGNLPISKEMAGVNMRLEAGSYRELHWHTAGEWALMLNGSARIAAINSDGQTFIDDVSKGDVWFFPSGVPHSIQGLENGTEFLLIFDDGAFSEDSTFGVAETFSRNPKEVLAKNFQLPLAEFDDIPQEEQFIFPGKIPPKDIKEQNVTGSAGILPNDESYSYHWSQQKPVQCPGGTVKILDATTFPIAENVAAAFLTIKPGSIREIHWHASSDEWNFFLSGQARIGVYASQGNSRTFDYQAGDVGYIPKSWTHYIENIGTEDVVVLEVLKAGKFSDFSLGQWLALTPAQVVKDTLHLSDNAIKGLSKTKPLIVPGPVPPATVQ